MGLARLLIPGLALSEGALVPLPDEAAQHARVLRLRVGDALSICDCEGHEAHATVTRADKRWEVRLGALLPALPAGRPAPRITLLQGLPKAEHAELVLQKATELGAARIWFVSTARAVPRVDAPPARWERIVREAARQCGRRELPALRGPLPLDEALEQAGGGLRLLCAEAGGAPLLRACLPTEPPGEIVVVVGPEGGFTSSEVEAAAQRGFLPVWLGGRILRTETAALAALAIVQHLYGDLG